MKNYFLISEFAKLRGININSLRYYEKLGILKPAHIDEKTGYRYYAPEQVSVLNKIILCIQLGIPLKEMVKYIDEDGNLNSQQLLEQGRIVAQKRIEEMQNNLSYIDSSLKSIEAGKQYADKQGIYKRSFEERKVVVTDYVDQLMEPKKMISAIGELYKMAQKADLFPILPAGQIIDIRADGTIRLRCYLEIVNRSAEHESIRVFPAGEYECMQVDLDPTLELIQIIKDSWTQEEEITVIVDNVTLDKYSFGTRRSELQKFLEEKCL